MNATTTEDRLLTPAQMKEILGCSLQTIYRIPETEMPRIRLASARGAYRVRQSALDAFINRGGVKR